ncbi:NADH-quinone oxidoreductase subunit NuoF [Geobacter sulfurreducens]|jgi:NADH-quinone oxidoreductase subunit F|uniref:NADH dehydrogenase I, F subunit n=1 Tax=Geobacter sulfurreducens (strain ATCC 51573 / DSM 12127 / PCA) TaxID=243231 RepID=Q746S7_GEOSL|nr:NADH-quinone oxidoreductase subunit NuoF [Geobacter sulfurreducens]AAR36831.1 NADH dehydrogenase I, F subunit [Geobacter sulfurreducens PCA]AJY69691.1 NADH dehydrogenase [Geobacter sulfurreducens]UAC04087.1 NADH-quinone oxidoreductase subunit NuoF [Geobacter sulfurreducens]UTG92724.1 NADH-quinone oxidoreductase subunit NuoF [Geobacter sulfurreducens]HBB70107.1 NADH-quinone oxidoreductase subunit NuoF [Geobacter sulfurreducens]
MEQVLFRHNRPGRCVTFAEYRAEGGFAALEKALSGMSPNDVQQVVIDANLRGRGGAGFPTGKKWSFVPRDIPGPRYLICNCDEMEPGTYKDRILLEANPYSLVEGMTLAAYAIGVAHAFIFIRRGYEEAAENCRRAIAEAKEAGLLGKNILGSGFSLDLDVHQSAGRYICGEETALMNALEGRRANPRSKPPFPAVKGLWGRPTVVNNVETLANIPAIVANGAAWFKGLARISEAAGTKLFCVSGHVNNAACFELPLGMSLGEIIDGPCGGMLPGREFKACIPGGASTPFFTREHWNVPMDFDAVARAGSRLGTGGIVVFDRNTCMVAATLNLVSFYARESCGWCTPCREGLPFVKDVLARIEAGAGREEHIAILREHVQYLNYAFCPLAPGAMGPVEGLLRLFEDEIREHIVMGRCPLGGKG